MYIQFDNCIIISISRKILLCVSNAKKHKDKDVEDDEEEHNDDEMIRMAAPVFRIRIKVMMLKQGGVGSARLRRWSNQSSTMKMFFSSALLLVTRKNHRY